MAAQTKGAVPKIEPRSELDLEVDTGECVEKSREEGEKVHPRSVFVSRSPFDHGWGGIKVVNSAVDPPEPQGEAQ